MDPLMLFNTSLSPKQLLENILLELGHKAKSGESKVFMIRSIYNMLLERYSQGRTTILIVDEAQNLSSASLEELRMLSNLETDEDKLLQIFLVGQPEFKEKLEQYNLRQLPLGYRLWSEYN